MKPSLFSQSLFSLALEPAIQATAAIGYPSIELACVEPHFSSEIAAQRSNEIIELIQQNGLVVSALSLFSSFSDPNTVEEEIRRAYAFFKLAAAFKTNTIKITPGRPGSAEADDTVWACFQQAAFRLVDYAQSLGLRLAVETHLRQLSDRIESTQRILDMDPSETMGVNLDFCNLVFGGDDPVEAINRFRGRIYLTHIKNGSNQDGTWDFRLLDDGMVDYPPIFNRLREIEYDGYCSVECLGPEAKEKPIETATHDYKILQNLLNQ
jgi:inosose dehydratase